MLVNGTMVFQIRVSGHVQSMNSPARKLHFSDFCTDMPQTLNPEHPKTQSARSPNPNDCKTPKPKPHPPYKRQECATLKLCMVSFSAVSRLLMLSCN